MANVLKPDKVVSYYINNEKLTINQKIMPSTLKASKSICSWITRGSSMKPNKKLNDGKGTPRGITIHNTEPISLTKGATSMAEQYVRATYNESMGGVVVHFYVYKNDIWQLLNEYERGWHATDGSSRTLFNKSGATYSRVGGNMDTISIECVGNYKESEETTAKLTAYLLKKYNLNVNDVYQHNSFYSKKNCPVYIRPHWNEFLNTVSKYLNSKSSSVQTSTKTQDEKTSKKDDTKFEEYYIKIIYDEGMNVREKPSSLSKKTGYVQKNLVLTVVEESGSWGKLKSGLGWINLGSKYVQKIKKV